MARRYDSKTTTFSPDGRLFQVEYAVAAINSANPAVGVCTSEGVVIAGEKKVLSALLAPPKSSEKLYRLDDHVCCAVAGLDADANILLQHARKVAQQYLFRFDERIPVESLVTRVSEYKQFYTQTGGLRPFGASFMYAGWDKERGYQLYLSDPSGNYGGWKAASMGRNSTTAASSLKAEYEDDMSFEDACKLAVRVLVKSMDTASPSSDRLDVVTLRLSSDAAPKPTTEATGSGGGGGAASASASAATSSSSSTSTSSTSSSATTFLSVADEAFVPAGRSMGPSIVQDVFSPDRVEALIKAAQEDEEGTGTGE